MLANRLKHFRIQAGFTVAELAARARVTIGTIYDIESGERRMPTEPTVMKLAHALDLDPDALFPPGMPAEAVRRIPVDDGYRWEVVIRCPKCRVRYQTIVGGGAQGPDEQAVVCPACGFSQVISIRRA